MTVWTDYLAQDKDQLGYCRKGNELSGSTKKENGFDR
jgi:hypothetical protein